MSSIDFILNVIGLLLWLNWRAIHLNTVARPAGLLVGTLRSVAPPPGRWLYLLGLLTLLVVRSLVYWQLGPALHWIPGVYLGATALSFRSDLLSLMFLFSACSFVATLCIFYLWLLVLSCINSNLPEDSPWQRFVQLHLGWIEPWPAVLKLLLPFIAAIAAWHAVHSLLVSMQLMPKTSPWNLTLQGLMIGGAAFITLKYLFIGILVLYLLNSYVYFGEATFWNYVDASGRNLLAPIRWIPLIIGRIDLAPVVGIVILLVVPAVTEWACGKWGLVFSHLFQRLATRG